MCFMSGCVGVSDSVPADDQCKCIYISSPSPSSSPLLSTDADITTIIIIVVVVGGVALLLLILAIAVLVCYCCFCRNPSGRPNNNKGMFLPKVTSVRVQLVCMEVTLCCGRFQCTSYRDSE